MRAAAGAAIAVVLLLGTGCSTLTPWPAASQPPGPGTRTHWELSHRVEGRGLQVIGYRIGHWGEGSSVSVVGENREDDTCYVAVAVPGQGGPDNMVGEKITTTFDGHPAVRNGAGAEGDYLMWRLDDGSWVQVGCERPGARDIDRVAAAVVMESTPVLVPFDLDVPDGYGVSLIDVDLRQASAKVYLGAQGSARPPEADLVMMFGAPELSPPTSAPTTIGGRPAVIDDNKRNPVVWVHEQGQWIYVGADSGDTDPYPNRSGDLPVLKIIAESVAFAPTMTDTTTWFPAAGVFG